MPGTVRLITSASLLAWLLCAAPPPAQAQSVVDGKWQADVAAPAGGTTRFVFEFTARDDELTGTLKVGDAPAFAIEDGRVRGDGSVIHFTHTSKTDKLDRVSFVGKVLDGKIVFAFARFRDFLTSGPVFTATRIQ